jgi:hypothetical protein
MHRLIPILLIVSACASGGGSFPATVGDPRSNMSRAKDLIEAASVAGADSLSPDAIKSARLHLAEADSLTKSKKPDRAALAARLAAADAAFAQADAQRAVAEKARKAEQDQVDHLAGSGS